MGRIKAIKGLGKAFLESDKKKKILTTTTQHKADMRIKEINRKIKEYKGPKQNITEDYVQEVADIYAGKWKGKQ